MLSKALTESGAKAYQRGNVREFRSKPYKDWHRNLHQNLMHSNLCIANGVYGVLSNQDLVEKISNLGRKLAAGRVSQNELLDNLINIAIQIKQNNHS